MSPRQSLQCIEVTDQLLSVYCSHLLPVEQSEAVREHLNCCQNCWQKWNHFRWERAKLSPLYAELKAFLGAEFQEYKDASWDLAREWQQRAPTTICDIDRFYQETENYIYTLAIWEASGNRPEYVNHALPYLQKYCACRILDFGCGIGTDGLKLLEQGYHVTFYDFRSLSLEFLVWRLQQRNWSAEVVFAGEEKEVPGFDSLWLMDVIEHLPNPQASLGPLLQRCRLLVYETDYSGTSGGRHPFHFQHSEADFRMFFQHMGFVEDCSSSAVNVWYRP